MSKNGKILIVSAPSGTGKTTVTNQVIQAFTNDLTHVITCTTRAKRVGEEDGKDYHFMTPEAFAKKKQEGGFLETKQIYENFYGTPKSAIEEKLKEGKCVLLVIDVEGASEIMKHHEFPVVSIFLAPPSVDEVERRIRSRGTETEEALEERVARAKKELSYQDQYDFVVKNDNFERACEEVREIFKNAIEG